MTDAQKFIDSSINLFNNVANDIERAFDNVAHQLRDALSTDAPFMPRIVAPPPPPPSTYQVITKWISKHRAITAAIIGFALTGTIGSGVFYVQSQRRHGKKRRAVRSASGARTEVVVIAGSISSPIASTLALDLERRGYIVYVVSSGPEDEHYVRSLQRADLHPLPLTLTDPYTAQAQLGRFQNMLEKEHVAFERAEPHKLNLKGLVFVPDTAARVPAGLIEDVSSQEWSDALNTQILNTIATTQLFLPMLKQQVAKILLLSSSSVSSSLLLPAHGIESTIDAALHAFFATCATECKANGVSITHFKLGNLDIPSASAKQKRDRTAMSRFKATPLRQLHDSVFDALVARSPRRTWYVGRGSYAYSIIGSIAPRTLVEYMMRSSTENVRSNLAIEGSTHWETIGLNHEP